MRGGRFRVGHGYDIHRLVEGRPLTLGGVSIEFSRGLEGHSDADVIVHAIIDGILGAAGLPDIGRQFPNTEPLWLGASSLNLLTRAVAVVTERDYSIANIDATLIAEAPVIVPYLDSMRAAIAGAAGVDIGCVNVKATTAEGLGPEGSREAMSAHAVVLLCSPE